MKTTMLTPEAPSAGLRARQTKNPCANCSVRSRAVCGVLDDSELSILARANRRRELDAGDCIFFEGDEAEAYYVVIEGSLKLYKLLSDGRRQVTGFLFKGDFVGLAFRADHSFTAEALEHARLCQMPRQKFDLFLDENKALGRKLLQVTTNGIVSAQEQMLLLGRKTAQERLASFLIWMSARAEERGEDRSRLVVPMSRTDMGDYLGLTVETVSRTMTKLKRQGVITLPDRRIVEIVDHDALEEIATA